MHTILKGICNISLIPVRKEPSERSELSTQIIFGETFDILEQKNDWSLVRIDFDGYTGWVTSKMIGNPSLSEEKAEKVILKESFGRAFLPGNNKEYLYLPGGSEFYQEHNGFRNAGYFLTFDPVCEVHDSKSTVSVISSALKYLHSPYLWGGRTLFGIDCSGFTQVVFKMNGINLPRDAHQQAVKGATINFLDETKPGDLAFFSNADGQIVHTGIIGKNHSIIHASGKVRIDKLDHQGIFNTETNKYSHTLRLIRRME